jgi:hypothetical protein
VYVIEEKQEDRQLPDNPKQLLACLNTVGREYSAHPAWIAIGHEAFFGST